MTPENTVETKVTEQPKHIPDTEPRSPLADGLPAWNLEPPEVVVRRKARAL